MYIKEEELNDDLRREHYYKSIRTRSKSDIKTKELWTYYKEHRIRPKAISFQLASKIFFDFNKEMVKKIIFFGHNFRLPSGIGSLYVIKRRKPKIEIKDGLIKNKSFYYVLDSARTIEERKKDPKAKAVYKKVYDDGHYYKLLWKKNGISWFNKSLYSFKLSRKNKKLIVLVVRDKIYKPKYLEG